MAHGMGDPVFVNIGCDEFHLICQTIHAVSHGHAVDDILQHGKVVGAVAEGIAPFQGNVETVLEVADPLENPLGTISPNPSPRSM